MASLSPDYILLTTGPIVFCDPRGQLAERNACQIQDQRDGVDRQSNCLPHSRDAEQDRRSFDSNAGLEASTPTLPTTRYACGGSNQQPRDAVTPRTLGAVFEASAVTEAAVRYRASAAAVEEPGISM
jgi:hypothetical protein